MVMKIFKIFLALLCLLLVLIPSLSVFASPDYEWFGCNVEDMLSVLSGEDTYTDNYLLFPVLPLEKSEEHIERENKYGKKVLSYCNERYTYKTGGYDDPFLNESVPYYDVESYISNGEFDSLVMFGGETPYTKDTWMKRVMTNSLTERSYYYESKSEKGKDLLIRDQRDLYGLTTNIKAFQLVEDKYVFCIQVSIKSQENVDYDGMTEQEYYTEFLKKLSDEVEFVKIPFGTTNEKADAMIAEVKTNEFDWQPITMNENSSTEEPSADQSSQESSEESILVESNEEILNSESTEDSADKDSTKSSDNSSAEESSLLTPSPDKDRSDVTMYIVIAALLLVSVIVISIIAMKKNKKH